MIYFRRFLLPLLILLSGVAIAIAWWRHRYGSGYFQPPLDNSLQLAANFGELRENHFHMGLDIRTGGREGLPVYAAADGFISRLEIQPDGLGYALFITHPNGLTTVYGHLSRFSPPLQHYATTTQYARECWQEQLDTPPGQFPVKKGDLIAYSGNTGASRAPHLHFEVRDSRTGRSINPLSAGFKVEDDVPPAINGLYWYDRRYSTYVTRARKIAITGNNAGYHTVDPLVRLGSPLVSLGINATDKNSGSPHLSGIFSADVWMDDSLLLSFRLHDFLPSETRYINACIDYTKWVRSGIYVQHLSILPGNHAPVFPPRPHAASGGDGLIRLPDTLAHRIRIRVSDANDNMADLTTQIQYDGTGSGSGNPVHAGAAASFKVRSHSLTGSMESGAIPAATVLSPGQAMTLRGRYCTVHFSAAAFYDQVPFHLQELPNSGAEKASALIHLHDATVPVHDRFTVQVRTTLHSDDPLRSRTVMQLLSGDSQYIVKGSWENGWMTGSFNRLGTLQLLIDTTAPMIATAGWTDGQAFSRDAISLGVSCRDNLGAIASFRGELDGHWIPFAPKGDTYTYLFDETCMPGKHRLTITVMDVAGNTTRKTLGFVSY